MGYYGNGFVLTKKLPWQAFASALPGSIAVRAYKHRTENVWFLDAWSVTTRQHWPFTDDFPEDVTFSSSLPETSSALLSSFDAFCEALPSDETPYGAGWLRATAHLSVVLDDSCFFFAGDDELTDIACHASRGTFQTFRVRFEGCAAEYSGGKLSVVPFDFIEDPETGLTREQLLALSQVPGVSLAPVQRFEGGTPLYGSAVALWPSGDPVSLLGVGTWDPFKHVEQDLEVVFEHLPAVAPLLAHSPTPAANSRPLAPSKAPWWRFWRRTADGKDGC